MLRRRRPADAPTLSDRAAPLIEEAAERSRVSWRTRVERLRLAWRSIFQASVSAALAWLIATKVLGHPTPFFAPVSAIITLGITVGQRGQRAAEVALGVALGIAVADLLVLQIGTGTDPAGAWSWRWRPRPRSSSAAGRCWPRRPRSRPRWWRRCSRRRDGISFARFLDALVGGGVALTINALVLPARPLDLMRRAAEPLLDELAAALEDVAVAVERRDQELAVASLERARAIDELGARFEEAVDVSRETTRYAPPRRRARGAVESYADAAGRIDLAVRNVRVLARGTIRALSLDENVPPEIAGALRDLAAAVRALAAALEDPERGGGGPRARHAGGRRGHAGARGHRQPVRERDRGPDPLDRRRPARRHGDELRRVGGRGARRRPRGRGRALSELGWEQVRAWRVARHGLAERAPAGELLAVASRLCGVHAQLMGSAELTLWARLDGLPRDAVARALWEDRTLVKTWAMRGTLHLLPAGELGLWLAGLGTYRHYLKPAWIRAFEITEAQLLALIDAVGEALGGAAAHARGARRTPSSSAAGDEGLREKLQQGFGAYLKPAAFRGRLCFGPGDGQKVRFTRPDVWLGREIERPDGDDGAARDRAPLPRRPRPGHARGPAALVGDDPGRGRQAPALARGRGARSTSRARRCGCSPPTPRRRPRWAPPRACGCCRPSTSTSWRPRSRPRTSCRRLPRPDLPPAGLALAGPARRRGDGRRLAPRAQGAAAGRRGRAVRAAGARGARRPRGEAERLAAYLGGELELAYA